MKYSFAATAALVAAVNAAAYGYPASNTTVTIPDSYVTKTLTELTTFCPGPTTVVQGGKTYTVTEATTLTITDCPCTVVEPTKTPTPEYPEVSETPEPSAPGYPETPSSKVPEGETPKPSAPAPVYPTGGNGTQVVPSPTGTGVSPPDFTGAAARVGLSMGALLAAGVALL